jgi:octaprenyl-diphosphate synthase
LNGAPRNVVESLAQFGEHLGVAYQIFDDCVDILGQERKAGKSLGTDVKKGKLTLPYLLLLGEAGPERRVEVGDMIFRDAADDRRELHRLVMGDGVLSESLAMIDTYVAQARADLACLADQAHAQSLGDLLDFLTGQSRQLIAAA